MSNITGKKTTKKGRPPKVTDVYSDITINVNKDNIVPPSKIVREVASQESGNTHYKINLVMTADQIESFIKVVETIHSITEEHCAVVFDGSGIVFQHKSKVDQYNFDARLFADKMISYYCQEKIVIKLDQGLLFKFLKNFKPSKLPCHIYIVKGSTEIVFETLDEETKVRRIYTIPYLSYETSSYGENVVGSEVNADNYDIIVMIDSSFFVKECKDMKGLSQDFQIYCNNKRFQVNYSKETVNYCGIQEMSSSIKFIKKLKEEKDVITKDLSTVCASDYTKCNGFSGIVKFYLSNKKELPVILEFDIDPEFGVFQAFLS